MKIVAAALLVVLTAHTARADELAAGGLHASAPRSIDFAGGVIVNAPLDPSLSSLPGVAPRPIHRGPPAK